MSQKRIRPGPRTPAERRGNWLRDSLLFGYVVTGLAYLGWRTTVFNEAAPIFSAVFYATEILIFLTALLRMSVLRQAGPTAPPPPPPIPWPSVDVFIPTYREPMAVVRRTLRAAVRMEGPHRTWLLDDGDRPEMAALAAEMGARYLARGRNTGAKAGNLNNGLAHAAGAFVAVLDADHVAEPRLLRTLMGYFADPGVAYVQSPQDYFNTDSFQHGRGKRSLNLWHEQSVFHWTEQPARNRFGGATNCGCSMIVRRSALDAIGGFPEATVTEDMHTAVKLNKAGWRSAYHAESLAYGVAPADMADFLRQRQRWGEGNMQVCRIEGVPFARGLGLWGNLSHIMLGTTYIEAWTKLVLYLAPLIFLFTLTPPIWSDTGAYLLRFLPYVGFGFIASVELGRGYSPFLGMERFAMARVSAGLLATAGLVRRRIPFRVTNKAVGGKRHGVWLAPQAALVAATPLGLAAAAAAYLDPDTIPPAPGVSIAIALLAAYNAWLAVWVIGNALRCARLSEEDWACPEPLPVILEGETGPRSAFSLSPSELVLPWTGSAPTESPRVRLFLPDWSPEFATQAEPGERGRLRLRLLPDRVEDRDRLEAALYTGRWRRVLAGTTERCPTWLERLGLLKPPEAATRPWSMGVWRGDDETRLAAMRPGAGGGTEAVLFGPALSAWGSVEIETPGAVIRGRAADQRYRGPAADQVAVAAVGGRVVAIHCSNVDADTGGMWNADTLCSPQATRERVMRVSQSVRFPLIVLFALLAGLAVAPGTAQAQSGGFIFGGVDASENATFGYFGGGFRPGGDINQSGWLLRGQVGYGDYDYTPDIGPAGDGTVSSLDAMFGVQNVGDRTRVAAYIGANYQDHDVSDPANPVSGDDWGVKGQFEVYSEPGPNTMALGIASWSTVHDSYFLLGKFGFRAGSSTVFIGPEAAAHGNERYDQERLGLHGTGFRVGPVGLSASIGYQQTDPGGDGAYASAGLTLRY